MSSALEYLGRQLGIAPATRYVVGFACTRGIEAVALVRKKRPKWQEGLLNGVGGHIEKGETPAEAMAREWSEECSLKTGEWSEFCVLEGGEGKDKFEVHFFHSVLATAQDAWQMRNYGLTDEEVEIYPVDKINCSSRRLSSISNIPWLLAMAKAHRFHSQPIIHAREEMI